MKPVIIIIFALSLNSVFSQKYNLNFKKDSVGLLNINYGDFDIIVSAKSLIETINDQTIYFPDSITEIITSQIGNTETIKLSEPEDNSFTYKAAIYRLIETDQIVDIVDNKNSISVSKLVVKKIKYKCPGIFSRWIWKGKSVRDTNGNEVFLLITERRRGWVNCGNL